MNIQAIKNEFPILQSNPDLVYLDNAATTQKPERVLSSLQNFYRHSNANIHRGMYDLAVKADSLYDQARQVIAEFVGVASDEIVFTKNATEAANMLAFGIGEACVAAGDNLIVSEMEHHANFLPWQEMARRKGADLRVWPVNLETMDLEKGWLEKNLDDKTRVIAVTMMSNVLGHGVDLESVVAVARSQGTLVVLDAVQGVVHAAVDLKAVGVDAAFFTGHKLYGPMGTGALYMTSALAEKIPPMLTGGGMIKDLPNFWFESPTKFEAGTPDVAGVVGLAEALRFLGEIGMEKVAEYERSIAEEMRAMLVGKPRIKLLYRQGQEASSILSFETEGLHAHDLASLLAEDHICVRAGHHCAKPLLNRLGAKAVTRISLGIYNQAADVAKVKASLDKAFKKFSLN